MAIFVIGLPSNLRARFVAEAARQGQRPELSLVVKQQYRYEFSPPNGQCVADLNNFAMQESWPDLTVVVLPYVALPPEMKPELQVLADEGVRIIRPVRGENGWPLRLMSQEADDDFTGEVYTALVEQLGWATSTASPAEKFRRSAQKYSDYQILGDALDKCDDVHLTRHRFLKTSAELLEKFCRKRGAINMGLAAYFDERGVGFATTGGVKTTIYLMRSNRVIDKTVSNMHLKDGDATTPIACPRIYFQHLDRDQQFRLYLIYVGPHPPKDLIQINRDVQWEHG